MEEVVGPAGRPPEPGAHPVPRRRRRSGLGVRRRGRGRVEQQQPVVVPGGVRVEEQVGLLAAAAAHLEEER